MEKNTYYAITVRKFSVLTTHLDWMKKTQGLYNEILGFYYNLYLDLFLGENVSDERTGDSQKRNVKNSPGSMEAMRELEKLTIVGREKKAVPYPLPWEKIPLYFRRAAINGAIAAARSYLSRAEAVSQEGRKDFPDLNSCKKTVSPISDIPVQKERTKIFTESVTFYKGMYKDFNGKEITLKLWNGLSWQWTRCRLRGNTIPGEGKMMSPALILKDARAELHIPWKSQVCDGRSAKERMSAGEKICSVVFTNRDACVVCCIQNKKGAMENCLFIKGGAEYAHYCRVITEKLKKSQRSSGGGNHPRANIKYWEKLKNISEHYAHQFSRQVIDYCEEHNAKILVMPEYDLSHRKLIIWSSGNYSPIYLSTSIRQKIKYKAWQAGIVVLESQQYKTSSVCSVCGGTVKLKGSSFRCENGHQGNRYLNMAENLGKKCILGFASSETK